MALPWALLIVAWAAKVAVVGLRVADGGGTALGSPWAPLALLYQDVWAALAFALLSAGGAAVSRRWPARARLVRASLAVAYAVATFWIAFNIPVVRQLSSPMTYAFVHATHPALGDSIVRYATPVNLALPAAIWIGGLGLPGVLARWRGAGTRAHRGGAGARAGWGGGASRIVPVGAACLLLLVLGPVATSRMDTLGLHRNAIVALVETTMSRGSPAGPAGFPDVAGAACRPVAPEASDLSDLAGVARGRSVLWVILESAGARFLAPYGSATDPTPNLTALARQAAVFDTAYAVYPESIKGLFSTLCSRMPPPRTEASEYGAPAVRCRSIARDLARAGYRTGLFHSGRFVYLGMQAVVEGRGFDVLEDAAIIPSPHVSSFGVDDRSTARRVLAFVDGLAPGTPFFAVYMPIAGHHPYHAPGSGPRPLAEASERDAYLNDLHVGDDAFGLLREGLRARGLDHRMLYVVFGDHGEAFREHHGNVAHALFLYEENVRVPLWIAAPGLIVGERRVRGLASLIDLAPTTLALLGLPPAPEHEGRSLLAPSPRVARFFTEQAVRRAGLRDGAMKLLVDQDTGRAQLFDLASDPDERHDLASGRPDLVRRYRACLGL